MTKPTVWVYALCYNEIHFMRNFFTAYKDAERITLIEGNSTDGSKELAQSLGAELVYVDTGGQIRDDIFMDIKNNCWKEARGKADWVIVVDFDEIFTRMISRDNGVVFDLDLSVPYNEGFNVIKPYGYNMISLDAPLDTEEHPFKHCQNGTYHPPAEKLCCFRPNQISEINFDVGAHTANPLDMNGGKEGVRIYRGKEYKMLHYKCWNYELYMEKLNVCLSRLSDINKKNGWGFQFMYPDTIYQQERMYYEGIRIARPILDIEV